MNERAAVMIRVMTTSCYTCDREHEFDDLPPREKVAFDGRWRVAMATGSALPGWLVLVPRRHVMEVAELSDAEAAALGVWHVRLARVLSDEFGVAKTYVVSLGEAPGFHLHFHVVPRPRDLAPDYQGPRVFGLLGREDDSEALTARDDMATRFAARLNGSGLDGT